MDSDTETDGGPRIGKSPRFDSKASTLSQEDETSTKEIQSSSLFVTINESKFSRSISLGLQSEKSSSGVSSMDLGHSGSTAELKDFPLSPSKSDSFSFKSAESTTASGLCGLCCQRPKNASLIHGRLGHQVCYCS